MAQKGLSKDQLNLESLPDPGDRYELGELMGSGVGGEVYEAIDNESGRMKVAIKVMKAYPDNMSGIKEEYRILRDLSNHSNLPDFYGAYLRRGSEYDDIWFVMQLCEGGTVVDLSKGLLMQGKRMSEEHISFILKETLKALCYLQENHVIHRDVRGSNILLTKDGEIKVADFGLSRELKSTLDRRNSCLGSPNWMAPELVNSSRRSDDEENTYDSKIDVWALGITAIEIGDGKPPFQDIHPTRAMFQIVKNPPPSLARPSNWSQNYNDFITECLEKNPEHRPFIMELMEHPFITALPENDFHFASELKALMASIDNNMKEHRKAEVQIRKGLLKVAETGELESMHVEDLAALDVITEDTIVAELQARLAAGMPYTFIGDVLLYLNPYTDLNIYSLKHHYKYQAKARSDNAPHIFSVVDSAYQDLFHHNEAQHILIAGETLSGKTTTMKHALKHLLFLGQQTTNKIGDRIEKSLKVIHAFANAATPLHDNSTRHVLQTQVTFTTTGKVSGAIFWLYQLEKWRVTGSKEFQNANFHMFYYFYDAMDESGELSKYSLESGRQYKYLRTTNDGETAPRSIRSARETPRENVQHFKEIKEIFAALEIEENEQKVIWSTLAAILLLGEVTFHDLEDGTAEVQNPQVAAKVAQLIGVDEKKFCWSLLNYCVVQKGTAARRRHTRVEATIARDVLARGLYFRLVDWIVNILNLKLSMTRVIFGDKYYINILDMFGFECFQKNYLEQLYVNTFNEQMQYHYNQKVFSWEMQEQEEEEIPIQALQFYDNKPTVDELMRKPDGLLYVIDEASRSSQGANFIAETLESDGRGPRIKMATGKEFCVAHYTGKVCYEIKDMPEKNRDFLPPEMIETLRTSSCKIVKQMFTNQLTKSGNLTISSDQNTLVAVGKKKRWGAALVQENQKSRKFNTESRGEYSQTRRMRTGCAVFRASCLEVLRNVSGSASGGGTHFVRCIRTDLTGQPKGFQPEVVRQQMRALAIVDTAKARQKGYSHRVNFNDFLQRYKFLAFDFDENVDITKENCRLLLIRLKMEGWVIGKNKVFLRYYNEEYLSRLYETQVKKIIKVQAMMRAFIAKKRVPKLGSRQNSVDGLSDKKRRTPRPRVGSTEQYSQDEAATIIQKKYRGYQVRKQYGPLIAGDKMEAETIQFIRHYYYKWKAKTMFQVLLLYRAAKHQDLIYFGQQVHLYNNNTVGTLLIDMKEVVKLDHIKEGVNPVKMLGPHKPAVLKLPFRLRDLPFLDNYAMSDPLAPKGSQFGDDESWDIPLRRGHGFESMSGYLYKDQEVQTGLSEWKNEREVTPEEVNFIETPYCRDPWKVRSVYADQIYRQESAPPPRTRERPSSRTSTKRRAPAPPNYQRNNYTSNDYRQNSGESESHHNYHNRANDDYRGDKYKTNGMKKDYDHILEMKTRGQVQSNNNADDEADDPPFNFQAMLRKTNHNRASLRRNYNNESTTYNYSNTGANSNFNSNQRGYEPAGYKPVPRKRSSIRHYNNSSSRRDRVELAPGIILEGDSADL
ncbi:unnamed protein product [Bemisia tabaci]|uniref:non-specific serine/threonine protein kinase n=1 Tax=Bemisia tabaci TaxID=7038 RepID=A0A9P0F6R1_BEMTA|nr:unnamed protein product [Bemisia tabaci]